MGMGGSVITWSLAIVWLKCKCTFVSLSILFSGFLVRTCIFFTWFYYLNISFFFLQISFSDWFLSKGGTRTSIQRMWDPVAYALGFIDCDNMSARCMLTIFSLFATKTEASLLRMLKGSPDVYLSGPIRKYITDKGGRYYFWNMRTLDEWNSDSLFAIFSYIHLLLLC